MKISELKPGETGTVVGYEQGSRAYRQKLLRMGLVKGCEFTLLRTAPLGDPVELELNSHKLTIRKSEAEALIIERGNKNAKY